MAEGRTAFVGCTDKHDGDLSLSMVEPAALTRRRADVLALPWTVCRQVHSDRLVAEVVDHASEPNPVVGDAVMTTMTGHAVAVHSADCVPVGFVHHAGAVAAAHAGWKGLERGVLEATVRGLRGHGAGRVEAVVGPHIRAARYEFGEVDLARLAARFGPKVVGRSREGTPALDLTEAIAYELERLAIPIAYTSPCCTADDGERFWSHRARREPGRFALVSWMAS